MTKISVNKKFLEEFMLNNEAYEKMESKLLKKYRGKWVVFEYGKLVDVADFIENLKNLSTNVNHRIVVKVGQKPLGLRFIGEV